MAQSAEQTATLALAPVVLDATVAGSAANAYITVDESRTLLMRYPQYQVWSLLTQYTQESHIITGTFYMDSMFSWYGQIYSSTQKLRCPRTILYDRDGRVIPAGTLPPDLKLACAIFSCEFAKANLLELQSREPGIIKRVQAGDNIEVDLEVSLDSLFLGKRFPYVENLIEIGGAHV